MNEGESSGPSPGDSAGLARVLGYVFEQMAEAVIVADRDRRVRMVNPAAEALFGYDEAELLGQETRILYAADEEFERPVAARFDVDAEDRHEPWTCRYRDRSGRVFEGETRGGPIHHPDDGGLVYLGVIRDVSARASIEGVLDRLHAITATRGMGFQARVDAILELGCEHFGLPIGIFSRIDGDRYEVVRAAHPGDGPEPGDVFPLSNTYCTHTIDAGAVTGFHHVAESRIRTHPCYEHFGLEAYLGSPVLVEGKPYGTLHFSSPSPRRPFTGEDYEFVRLFADSVGHELARQADLDALEAARRELEQVASTDRLTGLANRRVATERLEEELERMRRHDRPLVVALIDLDRFKQVNEHHGHEAGDQALVQFGRLAPQGSRSNDLYARWGGQRFLAILPETTAGGAAASLERLADRVRYNPVVVDGQNIESTVSIGYAIARHDDDARSLVQRADEFLYAAKSAGRDCVRGEGHSAT